MLALLAIWPFLPLLKWLKALEATIESLGFLGYVLYGLLYLVAELLLVPGGILLIGAGYLFGPIVGMAVAWPASVISAAISFYLARHLARERVERYARRHRKFAAIDGAIAEGSWKVAVLMRFSPIVPFALTNYMYGLTKVGFAQYLGATALGMLPGAFVYVYLGAAGQSFERGDPHSVWHWALLGVGLVATVAASVYLARITRRRLEKRKAA